MTTQNPDSLQLAFELDFDEYAEIKPYYSVNQSNNLLNARQDLDLTERRIIYSIISLVQPEDQEMKTYILSVKELANLIGISPTSFYERVEEAIDRLQTKYFVVEKMDKNGKLEIVDKVNWIQRATYLPKKGLVRIQLSDGLAKYLLNLKSYTKYQLYNVLRLKSQYSWRMYELLKEKEPLQKKRIFRVPELRRLLGIPDDKYRQTKNLRAYVIEQAKKELKEKTDIYFEYEVYRRIGRSIDSFIFYIYKNEENIRKFMDDEAINFDVRNLLGRMINYGINEKTAMRFIKEYHPRYIEDNIRYTINMSKNGNVENISAYIVSAIEKNYANSIYRYESDDDYASLYRLAAGDFIQKLNERTEEDINVLRDLYRKFTEAAFKSRYDGEMYEKLIRDRNISLYKEFEKIHNERQKLKFPPLREEDFPAEDFQLLRHFRTWKLQRESQFDPLKDTKFVDEDENRKDFVDENGDPY